MRPVRPSECWSAPAPNSEVEVIRSARRLHETCSRRKPAWPPRWRGGTWLNRCVATPIRGPWRVAFQALLRGMATIHKGTGDVDIVRISVRVGRGPSAPGLCALHALSDTS